MSMVKVLQLASNAETNFKPEITFFIKKAAEMRVVHQNGDRGPML
jgi:hypothetical protein